VNKTLKRSEQSIQAQWEALNDGECFFVPSLDADSAKKILLSMGYVPRKNAPEAAVGFFRGMWGVLCFRRPRQATATRRVRSKTAPTTDHEDA
jgi:hypothetical protein